MLVILEGPDESGKTTLAHALLGYADTQDLKPRYIKSPAGKDRGWFPSWDNWVTHRYEETDSRSIFVLDRVPEISEVVYSWALTRRMRARHPLTTLFDWVNKPIIYVNCMGIGGLDGSHRDPFGQSIRDNHYRVCIGYDLLSRVIDRYVQVVEYNRYEYDRQGENWLNVIRNMDEISPVALTEPERAFTEYVEIGVNKYVGKRNPDVSGTTQDVAGRELPRTT
jgi:hypothetical protein